MCLRALSKNSVRLGAVTAALEKHLQLVLLINEKYTLPSDVKLPCLVYTPNFPKSGGSLNWMSLKTIRKSLKMKAVTLSCSTEELEINCRLRISRLFA